jgi:hypothetical protein
MCAHNNDCLFGNETNIYTIGTVCLRTQVYDSIRHSNTNHVEGKCVVGGSLVMNKKGSPLLPVGPSTPYSIWENALELQYRYVHTVQYFSPCDRDPRKYEKRTKIHRPMFSRASAGVRSWRDRRNNLLRLSSHMNTHIYVIR